MTGIGFNESVGAFSTLFTHHILGSAMLSGIIILLFLSYVGLRYQQDQLTFSVVFTIPMAIILARMNYLPSYIEGVLIVLMAFIMGAAMWKFFRP
jgi:predicted anti-sigma-YlaC factor YlaD